MLIRTTLKAVIKNINAALPGYTDQLSVLHLQDMREIVQEILDSKNITAKSPTTGKKTIQFDSFKDSLYTADPRENPAGERCDMWKEKE